MKEKALEVLKILYEHGSYDQGKKKNNKINNDDNGRAYR